jgi:DNA-binding transcriptional regulator LsrR (DeoR family)
MERPRSVTPTRGGEAGQGSERATAVEGSARSCAALADDVPCEKKWVSTADVDNQIRVLLRMFYHRGKPSFCSVGEVADALGFNKPSVSRMLRLAYDAGMFRVTICLPDELVQLIELEEALKHKFGLREVRLVAGRPEILVEKDAEKLRYLHESVTQALADCAAAYLNEIVREREGRLCLGVAFGRTLHAIAQALLQTRGLFLARSMEVVPVVGITASKDLKGFEGNVIAIEIARAFRASSSQLPAPAFLLGLSVDRKTMCQNRQIRAAVERAETVDVVLTGMGPASQIGDPDAEMGLSNDTAMSAEIGAASPPGAIGDLCGAFFDRDGKEVRGSHEVMGLNLDGFRRIARSPKREVVLVTGGDRRRIAPLRVALRTGLASVVITDTATAKALLED